MIVDIGILNWKLIMSNLIEDEITSIKYIGEEDTIDVNVSGNHLFYANDILTHNSAVEEIEFDHSHIGGGLSKIQTADNVIGIFTSRAMRERGRYQIQFMKTRSSSGVGQKVDLEYNVDTLRIIDLKEEESDGTFTGQRSNTTNAIVQSIKRTSIVTDEQRSTDPTEGINIGKVKGVVNSTKMREILAQMNSEKD
jgi:hypothetical protein